MESKRAARARARARARLVEQAEHAHTAALQASVEDEVVRQLEQESELAVAVARDKRRTVAMRMFDTLLVGLGQGDHTFLMAILSARRMRGTLNAWYPNPTQDTLLTWAARHGQAEAVRLLLQGGASAGAPDGGGASALYIASQEGHLEIARLLRDAGAAVDQADKDGATPLFVACELGQLEVAQLLIEAGAAIEQPLDDGSTPLLIACHFCHLEVAKLLSSYGASRAAVPHVGTPEEVADRQGHADLAAWLVASRGWTPLAHLETLTAARATSLLRSGASLHEGEPTPLQRAAGGEGEAAALIRRAAAPWSPASHSLFPAPARARAALLVVSLYEIHERHHLDSAGATNGIAALDFGHCVLGFAIGRETE